MLGSAYFQRLLNQWDGSYPLAVASYNAGAGNVRKWVRAYGDPRGNVDIVSLDRGDPVHGDPRLCPARAREQRRL